VTATETPDREFEHEDGYLQLIKSIMVRIIVQIQQLLITARS